MQNDGSKNNSSVKNKTKAAGLWLYRHGVVFSAAMVVMSMASGLGIQLANKLGMNKAPTTATAEAKNQRQPYESPSYHVFSSVVSNEAKAIVNGVNMPMT